MKKNHIIFVTSIEDIPDIKEKIILTKCISCKLSICWHKSMCSQNRCRFCHCYYYKINKNYEIYIYNLFLYYYYFYIFYNHYKNR